MNKVYKKLVNLGNSSFLTEGWGSDVVTAMQSNLVDPPFSFSYMRIMYEWNHT